MRALPDTVAKQTTDHNTAASGGDSVIKLDAVSDEWHVIDYVAYSYDGAPTNGSLEIKDNTNNTILYKVHITAAGPNHILFPERGLVSKKNVEVVITLADGTAGKHLSIQSR